MKKSPMVKGGFYGLLIGFVVLLKAFVVSAYCLPGFISAAANKPWYCEGASYQLLQYLTFPINVLTNDLAQAAVYAPLTLLTYVLFGALVGRSLSHKNT